MQPASFTSGYKWKVPANWNSICLRAMQLQPEKLSGIASRGGSPFLSPMLQLLNQSTLGQDSGGDCLSDCLSYGSSQWYIDYLEFPERVEWRSAYGEDIERGNTVEEVRGMRSKTSANSDHEITQVDEGAVTRLHSLTHLAEIYWIPTVSQILL